MAGLVVQRKARRLLSQYPHFLACIRPAESTCDLTLHKAQLKHVRCMSFWEKDKKSGFGKPITVPRTQLMKEGVKMMKGELSLLGEEIKETMMADHNILDFRHGDYEYVWKFHDRQSVENWKVTSDKDNSQGYSEANFIFSKNNTGLFHGHLCQQIPKDGIVKRTGYCSLRSPTKFLSFKREAVHDWSIFTHLLLKVRGDGRPYLLSLGIYRSFDINWNDQCHYNLYTRGGPYWQTAKIPFSKFFVSSRGRIQDKQERADLDRVTHLHIGVGDGSEGPFYLEIDSIALLLDENHKEDFAYELYECNPVHVGT